MPNRSLTWRSAISAAAVAMSLFLLFQLLPGLFQGLELKTVDWRFQLRDRLGHNAAVSPELYNLSLDNRTLAASGSWFWDRSQLAAVIERMADAGTRVIGCDFIFAGRRDSLQDARLLAAFQQAGSLVTAYQLDTGGAEFQARYEEGKRLLELDYLAPLRTPGALPTYTGFEALCLPQLHRFSLAGGYVNTQKETDGVLRRYALVVEFDGRILPSFPLALLCAYHDYDPARITLTERGDLKLPEFPSPAGEGRTDLIVPLDREGKLWINYTGRLEEEAFPASYSVNDFLAVDDVNTLTGQLGDRIGIFSDISTSGKDFTITPLESSFPSSFIYTIVISNLLQRDFLQASGLLFNSLLLLLLLAGTLAAFYRWRSRRAALLGFLQLNLILPLLPLMIPLGLAGLLLLWRCQHREEQYQLRIESSLRSYLSPPLLKRMQTDSDFLRSGGTRKKISVLFSDIVGFTAFCDRNEPEEVQSILEEYLAVMVRIVFENGGIIDKYLGDGLLAFFENEDEVEHSPHRAVACAERMQSTARELRERWTAQNRYDLHIRVGITTGYAAVGNLGTPEKVDYTIIGSKVNLAQRLQSEAEPDEIIIDRDSWSRLEEQPEWRELGEINVKGFETPVEAFKK